MHHEPQVDTHSDPTATSSPAAISAERWRDTALALVLVALGAALGAAGGWLWWRWWGPPGEGEVFDTTRGPLWVDRSDAAHTHAFDAVAQYVVLGVGLGLVLGLVAAIAGRRRPLVALAALCVASAVGAALATLVGGELSPPDPQTLADQVKIGATLPDGMVLEGWTPYLAWPLGALVGFLAVMLSSSGVSEVRRREADRSTWLEARPRP